VLSNDLENLGGGKWWVGQSRCPYGY